MGCVQSHAHVSNEALCVTVTTGPVLLLLLDATSTPTGMQSNSRVSAKGVATPSVRPLEFLGSKFRRNRVQCRSSHDHSRITYSIHVYAFPNFNGMQVRRAHPSWIMLERNVKLARAAKYVATCASANVGARARARASRRACTVLCQSKQD